LWVAEDTTYISSGVFTTPANLYIETNNITNCAFLSNSDSWDDFSSDGRIAISTGSLSVVKSGSVYTFDFEGVDESGKAITAHFKGGIQMHQASSK
jgi:hypothetical protein